MKQFKKLSNRENIDLIPYIQQYIEKYPETQILIGTDSQNRKHKSIYALCIGLNRPGKGAHVIYSKYDVPRIKDNRDRLIYRDWETDRKSTRLNSSHSAKSRMPSSA